MHIFCTLSGLGKLICFCLFIGVVIGVSLHAHQAVAGTYSADCPATTVGLHQADVVPGYREEVSGWKPTHTRSSPCWSAS